VNKAVEDERESVKILNRRAWELHRAGGSGWSVPMRSEWKSAPIIFLAAWTCCAQSLPSADPTLDATGLPGYLKVLPMPAQEPWSRITSKQRFEQYTSLTFSPFAAIGAAAGGAISQAINSPREWGQGWGAYGIRVTSSYGANLVGNTITYGFSEVVHDDNRYFRSHGGGFGTRLGHVIVSPYVARNDEGRTRFSASNLLGSAGYSGIQLAWSPSSWQGASNVGINYLIWYGQIGGVNLAREFYPSVVQHLRNKGKGKSTNAP